ncbi:hypothetical protein A2U01_0062742, partial [Trifolium medium]|nr:hypothetical protein [Trifolium medium]
MDPQPTYETKHAAWLAFTAFHLLVLSFYVWVHTEPDMLKQGHNHYVLDLLFVMCELLFSFCLVGEMPRPIEKLAVDYAYTMIANGLMAISLAYFDCPFSLNAAEFI